MAIDRRIVEFTADDPHDALAALAQLGDGEWINIEPFVDEANLDDLRARTPHPLVRLFQKAGAPIPLGTVIRSGAVLSVGLEHGHGAKALPHLREHGVSVPDGWTVKQDHPRRGIVLEAPVGADAGVLLSWVLAAARVLSAVPVGANWTALVCRPG